MWAAAGQGGDIVGDTAGVILAGGRSRRMGRNKALLELGGRPMISIVADRLRSVVDHVIIAADDLELYRPYADVCVADLYPGAGTLAGIHAGLSAFKKGGGQHGSLALAVGCDMPFLNPDLLRWYLAAAEGYDVVVLRHTSPGRQCQGGEWVEPLHAAYRLSCLPAITAALDSGKRRVISFFDSVRVRYVTTAEVARLAPEMRSFVNINTPEDWRTVLAGGTIGR